MGREILITGEEILYRDVVAGQAKPAWKKGPSVNLSPLLSPDANTRMQVSGNQYLQLSALQTFFADAFAAKNHNHDSVYDTAGTAAGVMTTLRDNVSTEGDTLKKLYNLILSQFSEVSVANTAERNGYDVTKLPTNIFVTDDADGKWALYKCIKLGKNRGTDIKISDPDLLNAVMTGSQIAAAYEGYADVVRFTTALKTTYDAAYQHSQSAHAPAGAQVNVIEKIKYNGVEITPDANKTVNIVDEDIREILITYYSTNGALSPFQLPARSFDRTFTGYSLGDGATDFSVTISGFTYTKATITNVVLPANVKMTINSLTLTAGYTAGSASLLFK